MDGSDFNNGLPDDRRAWEDLLATAGARATVASPVATAKAGLIAENALDVLYGPLLAEPHDDVFVVAHLAQSLDGCVALPSGESQWITGQADQLHTHRLRALVDAVVVGVQTVLDDDPRLTVRHCPGRNPVRVVLDPRGRAATHHRVFDGEACSIRVCVEPTRDFDLGLPCEGGLIAPRAILDALKARGIRRVLIEGGGVTVSRFLAAGCVDRLHLVVAPMLLGGGRRAFPMPLCSRLEAAVRYGVQPVQLGQDWLFDCAIAR